MNEKNEINQFPINLYYFKKCLCCKRKISIQKITSNINKYQSYLRDKLDELNKNHKKFNGGTFFVVFPLIRMKEKFYNFFLHNYFIKLVFILRYIFECILFGCCVKKEKKIILK